MAWDFALGKDTNDFGISGGTFVRINGADEVVQRIRTAIWHLLDEYFLNVDNGLPWYNGGILGRTREAGEVDALLRRKILSVPGVLSIDTFLATFDTTTRTYKLDVNVTVALGPGDATTTASVSFPVEV
ncbi:MAG: hypothetical protein JKY94_17785 [Rhodobacteraceae bacterium]|nr:hypothetical protein [Paracoccaceae bacterium]